MRPEHATYGGQDSQFIVDDQTDVRESQRLQKSLNYFETELMSSGMQGSLPSMLQAVLAENKQMTLAKADEKKGEKISRNRVVQ